MWFLSTPLRQPMPLPAAFPDPAAPLSQIRHVVLDMDGTLYQGNHLFPETVPFLTGLRRLGIDYTFLTNNSSRSREAHLAHLEQLGIPCHEAELYTSTHATLRHLRTHYRSAKHLLILGTAGMIEEFAQAGYRATDGESDEPDAIIVSFDTTLTYEKLCRAAWWIARGKPYIATHPDRLCPTDRLTLLPDCGALCALLHAATGRDPDVVLGKPDPSMLEAILERHQLRSSQVAMVGDRLYTDIAMAHRAGVFGVLVLTGEARAADVEGASEPPDLVLPHLGELGRHLAASRKPFPPKGGR